MWVGQILALGALVILLQPSVRARPGWLAAACVGSPELALFSAACAE